MKLRSLSRAARIAWGVLALVAGLLLVAWLSRDAVLKSLMLRSARLAIPAEVSIDRVQTGLFPMSLRVTGLTVNNPKDYPPGAAFRVEEFYVRLAPGAFRGPTNQLEEIRLNISEISVISKSDGRNNFKDLFDADIDVSPAASAVPAESSPRAPRTPVGPPPDAPTPAAGPAQAPESAGVQEQMENMISEYAGEKPVRIGTLTLRMGVVDLHSDREGGKPPRRQHIEVNGEHTVRNVTDLEAAQRELGTAMLLKAMPSLLQDAMKDQ